jgi:hypothetical protein
LNIHEVNGVRQREIHAAEPLVPEPGHFEVEVTIGNLKYYNTPDIDQTTKCSCTVTNNSQNISPAAATLS